MQPSWRSFKPELLKKEGSAHLGLKSDQKPGLEMQKADMLPQPAQNLSVPLVEAAVDLEGRPGVPSDSQMAALANEALQPPTGKLQSLPISPFSAATAGKGALKDDLEINPLNTMDNSPPTASDKSKYQWSESPRQSHSDGEQDALLVNSSQPSLAPST